MQETWDEDQQAAINGCMDIKNRIVSVTGPAGVGKTALMRTIFHNFTEAGYRVKLAAPTGKAARRIQEATDIPAWTNHKTLEYSNPGDRDPKTGKPLGVSIPKRDHLNPLECDVLLVDEYAMVNKELNRNLIDALPRNAIIRPFGDMNQLGPIEENNLLRLTPSPFHDMLERFPSHKLTRVYRTGEGSGILSNSQLILAGKVPQRNSETEIKFTDGPVRVLETLILEAQQEGVDYSLLNNQIIAPGNNSWVGVVALNAMLQLALLDLPMSDRMKLPTHSWIKHDTYVGPGDKVIITKNFYKTEDSPDFEVFNGEVGIVQSFDEYGCLEIDMGDRILSYPNVVPYIDTKTGELHSIDPRKDIALAYALTTHKMQGSQVDRLIYVLNKSSGWLQCRPNIYTAFTRAMKHATIITDQVSLMQSVMFKESRMDRKAKAEAGIK